MTIPVVLSILDYEKKLLEEHAIVFAESSLLPDHLAIDAIDAVSSHWHWYMKLVIDWHLIADDEEFLEWHHGDKAMIWPVFERRLQFHETDNRYHFFTRVQRLLHDNPSFQESVTSSDEAEISMSPRVANLERPYWIQIVNLKLLVDLSLGRHSRTISEALTGLIQNQLTQAAQRSGNTILSHAEGEIEQSNYSSRSADTPEGNNQGNDISIPLPWMTLTAQAEQSAFNYMVDSAFRIWSLLRIGAISNRRLSNSESLLEQALSRVGFDRMYEMKNGLYARIDQTPQGYKMLDSFHDPLSYLEYIPWSDLDLKKGMYIWKNSKMCKFDHHLISEEEVFNFCVLNDLVHPNYLVQGALAFHATPLSESTLVKELPLFWEKWNDCAVTQNPLTEEYYILETLPGKRFRTIWDQRDMNAALSYFRRFVDDYQYGMPGSVDMILGDLGGIELQFPELLRLIPFHQLTEFDPTPLGSGVRGTVYCATWMCPRMIDMPAAEPRRVAVKVMRGTAAEVRINLRRELYNVCAALQGQQLRTVHFHGICKVPAVIQNKKQAIVPADSILMIYEYADKGSILQYLDSKLSGGNGDWDVLFSSTQDIADALAEAHSHGFIHRDLHDGNVLVRTDFPLFDPAQIEVNEVILADFGEGSDTNVNSRSEQTYYGNPDFWAPEIIASHRYSTASDIYALGCLIRAMYDRKIANDAARGIMSQNKMPLSLLKMALHCLAPDPSKRLTARQLTDLGDDLAMTYSQEREGEGFQFEHHRDMVELTSDIWDHVDEVLAALEESQPDSQTSATTTDFDDLGIPY